MSQRFGYPHASSSDYFIDNPQVVRQLDASPTDSQPTNGSKTADKEAPGGTGTNADDVRSERVPDYANNGPRASGSAYFIDRPSGGSPIAIVPADDSVFDGTTMITEIQEPLIACDSLAGMNANTANTDSVTTAVDGSEQSTNVIKGICADSVLQPAKSVALDNSGAETCSSVPIVENPSATTVEVPESGFRSGIAHSGSNQASTAPEDGYRELVTVRNAPVTPLTPIISAKTDIAEVTTARESSSADSVRTALEASDAVNTARETRSATDMRTAIEPSDEALLTALEKSDTVGTARGSSSDESLLTAIETPADVTTAQESSEGFVTTRENAPISKMMTAVEAIHTALDKSEVLSTAREAVIDAQAEVSTAQGLSDARATGSTTYLDASEGVQTAHERSDHVSPSIAHEVTTTIEVDSGPSEVRTAVEKSEELATVIETSEAAHTALDKSDDVITAHEAVIDAETEVATSLERSDARATGSTIYRLANIKPSKEVRTAHEISDQVTTAHQVTTVIETDSEPSQVRTAVETSEEFGEKPVSTDEVLTARQGTEDVTTARDSTSSRNLHTAIEAPNAQLTAVEQTGAPSSSYTSVPAASQLSFLVNISATSSSILTVVLMLFQILRTFIDLVVRPPGNLPADCHPIEAQVLTAIEMPDELTARSDSCASLHTSIGYKHEDAYADTEVDRTSSATRGLNAECVRPDETSGSVKQLNPSDEELHTAATFIRELALDAEVHTAIETPSVHDAIDLRALSEDTPDLKTYANV